MTPSSLHSAPIPASSDTASQTVRVFQEIDLKQAGGILFHGDLNCDGVEELLILQTPGLFHAAIHGASSNIGWDHFCLTAMNQQGDILWRIGEPWQQSKPYASHGGERSLVVFDLDGDGLPEVYVIRGSHVLKVEAATGCLCDSWSLPYDNFVALCGAHTDNGPDGRRLLASPSNQSYDNHSHGGPTLLFNAQGEIQFQKDIHGFGHDPVAVDLNGDGFDEWLVGYEMLDRHANPVWRFDPVAPDAFDDMEMHVDGLSLHLNAPQKNKRIAYAASTFVFMLDLDGNRQWSRQLVHPQQVIFTHLLPDRTDPQLLVVNKRDTLQLFDFDGALLWTREPEPCWPQGKTTGVDQQFHLFDPCIKLSRVMPDGTDAVVYMEGGWPYAIGSSGERVFDFECPQTARQPAIEPCRRPDDFGAGYLGCCFAQNNQQTLVIGDRRRLWLFKLPKHSSKQVTK